MSASQFMLGALIAFMAALIVLALVTGRAVVGAQRAIERSEDPVFFWGAVGSWACALVIAVWMARGRKF